MCAAVVLAIHALLIVGLPRWGSTGKPGLGTGAFTTRIVGPATPEPPQQAAQAPVASPPEPTPPKEAPPEPPKPVKPEPSPTPKPVPKKPKPSTSAAKSEPTATETSTPKPPATGGTAGTAGTGTDQEPSILAMPPPPQFGPFPGVTPIGLRPTDAESRDIRPSIKSAGDAPVQIPHSANVTYQSTGTVGGIPVVVPTRVVWRHDGTYYESSWIFYHVKAGEQSFYSNGLVTPQGLAPLMATYRSKGDQKLNFDHAGERLVVTPEIPDLAELKMPPGTQDRLSALVQLSALLAADPKRYPLGSSISLPVAIQKPPSVLDWSFVVGEEETLENMMNGKTLKTVRLTHESTGNTDTRMELWLAPALEYLPARIRVEEPNGDFLELMVQQAFGLEVTRSVPDDSLGQR